AKLALEIGKQKKLTSAEKIFYRPEREAQILQNILKKNEGPLNNRQMSSIFRALLTACLSLQQPLRVAFLGPSGTYSQKAAFLHFGEETTTEPVDSIPGVFQAVENEKAD